MDASTRDALVVNHLPLVHRQVGRVRHRLSARHHADDLVSAGMLGLMTAAHRFDPAVSTNFAAFATRHVRGAILDEMRGLAPLTRAEYQQTLLPDAPYIQPRVVFNSALVDDTRPVAATETRPDPIAARRLRHALAQLAQRERHILLLRFWGGASTEELTDALRVSAARVYQLQARALQFLRREMANEPDRAADTTGVVF